MATESDIVFLHAMEVARCTASVDKSFDYHTLQVMTSGRIVVGYDRRRHELEGRWAWPAMPGVRRITFGVRTPGTSWHHRYAAFTGKLAERWRDDGLLPVEPQRLDAPAAAVVVAALDETIEQVNRPGRWARLKAANALERAMLHLAEARSAGTATQRPPWLTLLLERLGDAEGPEVELSAEAGALALSVSTLRRHIVAATGLPPAAYRLQHKLAAARVLLSETDEPIKRIAQRLGYGDVYHFSRHFSKKIGVPPAAFRRTRQDQRPGA